LPHYPYVLADKRLNRSPRASVMKGENHRAKRHLPVFLRQDISL
jgi:hypothetical protein